MEIEKIRLTNCNRIDNELHRKPSLLELEFFVVVLLKLRSKVKSSNFDLFS